MVTMSQKSSVPQAAKSVSQALMPDTGRCLHDDVGRAGNQITRLEQPVDRRLRHKVVGRIGNSSACSATTALTPAPHVEGP